MAGYRSVSSAEHLDVFIGEHVRVITENSHYRGECTRINVENNNVLLKNVVLKNDTGWIDVSDHMLVMGHSIESLYIEKSFPFESNESLILSFEDGSIVQDPDQEIEELTGITEINEVSESGFPEEFE